jgi:hypothetical protein
MGEARVGASRQFISQVWQEQHKKVLAVAVLAWVVCITLVYQTINVRRNNSATAPHGTVAKILPVGGLPVT